MYIYYDENDIVTSAINCLPHIAPVSPRRIEVPDDTPVAIGRDRVEDGALVPVALALDMVKAQAIDEVNSGCNTVRQKFITPLTGQDMVYLQKELEAKAYLTADPEPVDLTDYPFIAAEVGSTAPTPHAVAQTYANQAAQWRIVGSQLEQLRIGSIVGIESATDAATIEGVLHNFSQMIEFS